MIGERKKVGSMEQLAYARNIRYEEGRASGMRAVEVKSGDVRFVVSRDKCMDITELSYKGIQLNFLSKPGLQNRQHYDSHGGEAQRSIMGGMFFTCGTDNVGTYDEETCLPMHGTLRSTPAEHVCSDCFFEDGEYRIRISGQMRQAALFGENTLLRRTIETKLGARTIRVHDEFENQAFEAAPFMLLYHCNIGYPLLDEGARILIPSRYARLREEKGRVELPWDRVEAPADGAPEQVFFHEVDAGADGLTYAAVVNEKLGIGLKVIYNKNQLPRFTEWKSMASGDYVVGLEPCNCYVHGRKWEQENGSLQMLGAGERRTVDLEFEILEL